MSKNQLLKPVCQNCGNEHIECRRYASWSIESQEWEVFEAEVYCFECENGLIEFVPLELKDMAVVAIKNSGGE
jgi:hypothetical protein